ncbi:hypothetical protein PCANC_05302 [Puccinia coronata f. sp. avenae]|uniref:Uncharacterized protein n=1 Tax=Puccinia coronata f. sp. avenae TaxID=200324 RepID=A0A2N5VYS9_9BASI|nr:hypothetical protein PCASD_03323 [Puccinia coronata f. sp. avenae]PLW55151.1 hypothetical protein PCANC_05302 [Puccinia coronata f. sp. avenae]
MSSLNVNVGTPNAVQRSDLAPRIRISPIRSRTRRIPGPGAGLTGFSGTKILSFFNDLTATCDQESFFTAEGLKASVEANLNAKNSLQMVSEALLDPLELSGRIPDF